VLAQRVAAIATASAVLLVPAWAAPAGAASLEFVNTEVDRTGILFPELWQVTDDSAILDTDLYKHEHYWTIPRSIPAGGADASATTVATDKSGGRVSAKTTLFGSIVAQPIEVVANADLTNGPATATDTKTTRLAPTGSGPQFVIARSQDGPDVRFNFRLIPDPPRPTVTISPRTAIPQLGVPITYRLPRPLHPVVLGFPPLAANTRVITAQVAPARVNGPQIDDDAFTFGVAPSDENVAKAAKICEALTVDEVLRTGDATIGTLFRYAQCAQVVSRILQRAEELRKRSRGPTAVVSQTRRCRTITVPLRGASRRARRPWSASCRRTPQGLLLTIKARRSLRSALGRSPKLIVGRTRARPARRGDNITVTWNAR
jgi:hypothetical protein